MKLSKIERVKGLCTNCREDDDIQIVAMVNGRTGPAARAASGRRGGGNVAAPRSDVPPPPAQPAPPPAAVALAAAARAAEAQASAAARAEAAREPRPAPEPAEAQGEEDLCFDVHEAALNLTRREAEHAKANVDAFGIYQCSDVSAIISL